MKTMKAAVYPASRLYYEKVIPSIKSLMVNSDVDRIFLTIEDDEYPEYLPECVTAINAGKVFGQYLNPQGPNISRTPYVWLCMIRVVYSEVFLKQYGCDRVLALDGDTIVMKDIGSEPWTMDLEGCHFAGVAERKISASIGRPYANMGVSIFDLNRIHQDGLDSVMLGAINREPFMWLEQDVINKFCKLKPIGSEWNACQFTAPILPQDIKIRHFAYEPGWENAQFIRDIHDIPWETIEKIWKDRKKCDK